MQAIEYPDFWKPRRCMREPVPEIVYAANLLDRAVGAHLSGDRTSAAELFNAANLPSVRAWTESLWGGKAANQAQISYQRYRAIPGAPPHLPLEARASVRMPTKDQEPALIERYGRNCVFCGIPLISDKIRKFIAKSYPHLAIWGKRNVEQHAAFQCMWLQYDHVVPHSRGGDSSIDNVVLTCAPCNYARWHWTLEEVGLLDPRHRPAFKTSWDGLERFR